MNYDLLTTETKKILAEYTGPLTLRQLYYRLVSKQLIPNTRTSYTQLSKQLVKAREEGHIDRGMLEDRGRQVLGADDWGYESPQAFLEQLTSSLRDRWQNYQKPLWAEQQNKILICVEKDALSSIFTQVAKPYRIKVFPNKGYCSFSYIHQILAECDEEKPNVVLYFGDYDPSGRDIERSLVERLGKYGAVNFKVVRVALTEEQIRQHNLPPKPEDMATLEKLQRDPRARTYGTEYACELDALDPLVLHGLIKSSIEACIDGEVWKRQIERQEIEREAVKEQLQNVKIMF
jgi:hypothetical protein